MKLTELQAEFVSSGDRRGVGVALDCPCGSEACNKIYVPFDRPLDGSAPDPGATWQRTGDTIETLTLRPSVLRLSDCRWHGFVTNGEAVAC